MKRISLTLLLFCAMAMSFAQNNPQPQETQVKITDKTWCDRGFDFYIGGGMLFGSPFNANYYNGSSLNENSLNYVFSNQYWYEEWQRTVSEAYPHISMSDHIYVNDPKDFDWNLNYKLSMMVSLGARYKLGKGWAIALSYQFSRLTTSTQVLLSSNAVTGNMYKQPVVAIVGKEYRSMIDLSASYLFSQVHKVVKPFVELGLQFNYAKAKSFDAVLLDKENHLVGNTYSLLNIYTIRAIILERKPLIMCLADPVSGSPERQVLRLYAASMCPSTPPSIAIWEDSASIRGNPLPDRGETSSPLTMGPCSGLS